MKTEALQKLGASALLLVVALLSALWLAGTVSSPELHAKALAELDEKKITVMELTAATAVTSVAVSAVPGDATTPLASKIADLSSYLLLVVGAIMLEKLLLTMLPYAAFTILIPAACVFFALSLWRPAGGLRRFAAKLVLFGLAICLVVPASLRVSRLVENTLDVQQTIDSAAQSADDVEKEAGEADDAVSGGWLSQIGEQITSGVTGAIDAAEQALSRFIDAIAVLLIVNCVVPILVLWFFLWLAKAIWGIQIDASPQKIQSLRLSHRNRKHSETGDKELDPQP